MPTLLVTGANRGLGLEFVRQYAADGWRIIACCRVPAKAEALKNIADESAARISIHQVDVADIVRIEGLAAELKDTAIDVLINCAGTAGKYTMDEGALERSGFGSFDAEEWLHVFRVNVMAPMKMCEVFVDNVAASQQKKLITLTSELGSIGDNRFGHFYPYRASKAAVNAIMKSIAIDLAERGIISVPLHPGWVKTDMGGKRAPVDAPTSIRGMRRVIAELSKSQSGRYLTYEGKELPW